jgi:hypothetical protein
VKLRIPETHLKKGNFQIIMNVVWMLMKMIGEEEDDMNG